MHAGHAISAFGHTLMAGGLAANVAGHHAAVFTWLAVAGLVISAAGVGVSVLLTGDEQ